MVDKDLQRELQNFEVYCSNEPTGCNWEGIFKNIIVIIMLIFHILTTRKKILNIIFLFI
jgi:glycerol-3-phosphate dehydrogenase